VYTADNSLNLDTLLIQIKAAATPLWYQLGEVLGIDKESLDRYSSHPPEESIIEMLDQWLRSGPQRRTWRDVAEALKKIGLEQLASDIEKVYETGNLTYSTCSYPCWYNIMCMVDYISKCGSGSENCVCIILIILLCYCIADNFGEH
jgi:hypothetical protein